MNHQTITRSARPARAAEILGVSLPTLWRYLKQHDDFPQPRRLSARCTVFDQGELIAWRDSRTVDAADAKPAVKRDEAAWKRAMIERRAGVAQGGAQ